MFDLCQAPLLLIASSDNLPQFFKGLNITADQKKFFKKAFQTYYEAVAELLQSEHTVRIFLPFLKIV
jgi:hypothetical protein